MSKKKLSNKEGDELKLWRIAFSNCRTCKHSRFLHEGLSSKHFCLDSIITQNHEVQWCKCKEFIPADNLDYLEWKYTQKKGKK